MKALPVIWFLVLMGNLAPAQIKLGDIKEDAWYSIVACHSGKTLEIRGGVAGKENGLPLQQNEATGAGNQLFQFKQVQSGYFEIIAKHSGKVLEIRDNSLKDHAPVQQNEAKGRDNQMFTLVKDTDGAYSIIARSSGYGFDVLGGVAAVSNNVPVIVYPPGNAKNQKFRLIPVR